MKCQRCLSGKEARYRAYTDVLEIDVCRTCAVEARRLGISLAWIESDGYPTRSLDADRETGRSDRKAAASKRYSHLR